MLSHLLDTNICIYIAREKPASVAKHFAKMKAGSVGMSLITYGELRYGAEKSSQRETALETLARLQNVIPVIAPDLQTSVAYGAIRTRLERAGTPIGNNDLWIAAHAMALNATLVTNNLREFERVPGLKLVNWVE